MKTLKEMTMDELKVLYFDTANTAQQVNLNLQALEQEIELRKPTDVSTD